MIIKNDPAAIIQTFSIRCFVDNKRRKSHELTLNEAINLRKAALHLAKYLKESYYLIK
jgi:hypothetical protein